MFVQTQFETVVNIANFDKIKIDWHVKTGNVKTHIISAESQERHSPQSVSEPDVIISKFETLAEFREEIPEAKVKEIYERLYRAIGDEKPTFDLGSLVTNLQGSS